MWFVSGQAAGIRGALARRSHHASIKNPLFLCPNHKALDVTITKLTRGNPTMAAQFAACKFPPHPPLVNLTSAATSA